MIDEGNPRASAADAVRQGLSEAAKATQQATSDIGKDLGEDLRQTRDRVMEQAESAKQGLAGQVKDTADALNAAAEKFGPQAVQTDLFHGAARGLEALSEALGGNTMSELASDLTAFGRRNPAAFLGVAAIAGFAIARFAQASASTTTTEMPGDVSGREWETTR
jgi:hypothetical protein